MILKTGTVSAGEYRGWDIQIIDDSDGDTGGFYLILQDKKGQIFDCWFEKQQYLNNQLADFDVVWSS